MSRPGALMRLESENRGKVFTIELFFDLVYVFAISQLAHAMLHDLTWGGALRALILLSAVWWVWIDTTWVSNWLDPSTLTVRFVLIGVMFGSLVMSASIPEAFGSRAAGFAGAYVAIQVLRTVFFIWAVRNEEPHRPRNFQRILCWYTLAGCLWLTGIWMEGNGREMIWILALLVEFAAPAAGFYVPGLGRSNTREWDVSGAHLAERCQLFIIIALGEGIISTGRAFADHPIDRDAILAFAIAFAGGVALWWIYFSRTADYAEHAMSASGDPGRFARSAYTYSHLILIAGIVLTALGDELVVAHPDGHLDVTSALVITGSTAIYLAGLALFKWFISGAIPVSLVVAIALLGVVLMLHDRMDPVTAASLTMALLVALAVIGERHVPRAHPDSVHLDK